MWVLMWMQKNSNILLSILSLVYNRLQKCSREEVAAAREEQRKRDREKICVEDVMAALCILSVVFIARG